MAAGVAGRQASPLFTDVCDLRFLLTSVFYRDTITRRIVNQDLRALPTLLP